jgi:hypothetical protein
LRGSPVRRIHMMVKPTGMACWLILIHSIEISVWGLVYFWQGCLPRIEDALYFSGTTSRPLALEISSCPNRGGYSRRLRH